jgi:hypothetical protein
MILRHLLILLSIAAWASPIFGQGSLEYQHDGSGGTTGGQTGRSYGPLFQGSPRGSIGGSGAAASLDSSQGRLAQEQQRAAEIARRWPQLGQTYEQDSPQHYLEQYNKRKHLDEARRNTQDPTFRASIMTWPWIKSNPTDWDRINYAQRVSGWAEKIQPSSSYSPVKGQGFSQAEVRILAALKSLHDVHDTEGSALADEQREELVVGI